MTRRRLARAIVALVLRAGRARRDGGARARRAAFTIGVLRRDGIVIPFATFDGKEWRIDWPTPKEHVDVPITLASVPKDWWGKLGPREEWQAWVGAEPPRVLHVTQPDWFPAQCFRQVGLRTDYRPARPVPPIDTQPYPKDGLAVSPPTEIEPIEIVPPGEATPPVLEAFNTAERPAARAARFRGCCRCRRTTTTREAVPVQDRSDLRVRPVERPARVLHRSDAHASRVRTTARRAAR